MSGDSPIAPGGNRSTAPGRRRRALKIGMVAVGVLGAVVVGTVTVAYIQLDRNINTFSEQGISKRRPPPTVHGQNILLIGSDSRDEASARLGGDGSRVGRSDTTLLVHIYEGGRRAVAVSLPRDAMVDIPPCRLPDGSWSEPQQNVMFNTAYSVGKTPDGNPACTVNTVEKLTGLRVDHTVVADFAGFAAMTDIVGGVPVCLPEPVYQGDINPNLGEQGKLVFEKGTQTVSGQKALDYVRLRYGIGDGSDIGRMRRQQAFLGSVVAKVRAEGMTLGNIVPLARAATTYLTFDGGLDSARQLVSFALGLRHMSPENVLFVTTPWKYDGPRVALVHPDVDRLWTALRNDEPLVSANDPQNADKPRRTTGQDGTGREDAGRKGGGADASEGPLPESITGNARSAATDPCQDLTYGAEGEQ